MNFDAQRRRDMQNQRLNTISFIDERGKKTPSKFDVIQCTHFHFVKHIDSIKWIAV